MGPRSPELVLGERTKNLLKAWDQWEILRSSENHLSGDERKKNLESIHTHTLFFLAQATKTAGLADESADYCGQCLKRQLDSGDFVPKGLPRSRVSGNVTVINYSL